MHGINKSFFINKCWCQVVSLSETRIMVIKALMSQYTIVKIMQPAVMQTNLQAPIVNGLGFKFETSQPTAPGKTGDASPP